MLTAMAWILALMAMGHDAPPGTFVTAEEHGATLKQSVANNTVDTLVKSADIPGGKASVAVLYRTKPEASALIHERATEVYQILEGSGHPRDSGGRLRKARQRPDRDAGSPGRSEPVGPATPAVPRHRRVTTMTDIIGSSPARTHRTGWCRSAPRLRDTDRPPCVYRRRHPKRPLPHRRRTVSRYYPLC